MDIEKRAHHLSERLNYIRDIFDGKHPEDIELLHNRLNEFFRRATEGIQSDPDAELTYGQGAHRPPPAAYLPA